jgi:hypothetical protein
VAASVTVLAGGTNIVPGVGADVGAASAADVIVPGELVAAPSGPSRTASPWTRLVPKTILESTVKLGADCSIVVEPAPVTLAAAAVPTAEPDPAAGVGHSEHGHGAGPAHHHSVPEPMPLELLDRSVSLYSMGTSVSRIGSVDDLQALRKRRVRIVCQICFVRVTETDVSQDRRTKVMEELHRERFLTEVWPGVCCLCLCRSDNIVCWCQLPLAIHDEILNEVFPIIVLTTKLYMNTLGERDEQTRRAINYERQLARLLDRPSQH